MNKIETLIGKLYYLEKERDIASAELTALKEYIEKIKKII